MCQRYSNHNGSCDYYLCHAKSDILAQTRIIKFCWWFSWPVRGHVRFGLDLAWNSFFSDTTAEPKSVLAQMAAPAMDSPALTASKSEVGFPVAMTFRASSDFFSRCQTWRGWAFTETRPGSRKAFTPLLLARDRVDQPHYTETYKLVEGLCQHGCC